VKALLVVDAEVDFVSGSLPVPGGQLVVNEIAAYLANRNGYDLVLATMDCHADNDNNGHFETSTNPADFVDRWPVHCVQGTPGAQLQTPLQPSDFDGIFTKGFGQPAYSGFDGFESTFGVPLDDFLKSEHIDELDICGIAGDYCVLATTKDTIDRDYKVRVLWNLVASMTDDIDSLKQQYIEMGAEVVEV
jgi:nicotinamidase/pyrazinamidase